MVYHYINISFMAIQDDFEKQGKWLLKYGNTLMMALFVLMLIFVSIYEMAPDRFYFRKPGNKNVYEYLCVLCSLFGFAIRIAIVGYSPLKSNIPKVKGQVAGKHFTTGLYSIMRHPKFIAHFFIFLGPVLISGKVWHIFFYVLIFYLYNERIMFATESILKSKFGIKYSKWADKVPAIIPNIYLYKKPELGFNIKKVIDQEIGHLTAIFIIFSAFDIATEFVNEKKMGYNRSLLLISGILIVLYLIFKVPKILKRLSWKNLISGL